MTTQEQIVVVEDDASMQQAIQRLLRAAGFRTQTFSSAEALLQSGAAAGAACFVFDIHLPGLSGLELWRRLVAGGIEGPVIFITAHDETATREAAERSGAVAFLLKPFPGRSFLAAIGQAISRPVGCSHSKSQTKSQK
jgi:FixJ family two-component response regulator